MRRFELVASILTCGALLAALVAPATAENQASASSAAIGNATFQTYCASCHGRAGNGDGPVGKYLNPQPSDLTTISARRSGTFPAEEIHDIIDGRDMPGHGLRDMPVWGNAFKIADDTEDEELIRLKIHQLVVFLESIQKK